MESAVGGEDVVVVLMDQDATAEETENGDGNHEEEPVEHHQQLGGGVLKPTKSQKSLGKLGKPKMTYPLLIAEALMSVPDRMLALNEIYNRIHAFHPFYRIDAPYCTGWQNSIR